MIAFEFVLIAMATILITILQPGSADKTTLCIELISEDAVFKKGRDNDVWNFQNAYKNLSIEKIKEICKAAEGDTPDIIHKKSVKQNLMTRYFNNLFAGKRLKYKMMELPVSWCNIEVSRLAKKGELINSDSIPDHMARCTEYTLGYLFYYADNRNKAVILTKLYNDWYEDRLLAHINVQTSTDLSLTVDMTPFYIEHYSLGYFRYVEEVYIKNRKHFYGQFNSIEEYCVKEGYIYA